MSNQTHDNLCQEVEDRIAEVIRGEADERLLEHIASCDRCRDLRFDAEAVGRRARTGGCRLRSPVGLRCDAGRKAGAGRATGCACRCTSRTDGGRRAARRDASRKDPAHARCVGRKRRSSTSGEANLRAARATSESERRAGAARDRRVAFSEGHWFGDGSSDRARCDRCRFPRSCRGARPVGSLRRRRAKGPCGRSVGSHGGVREGGGQRQGRRPAAVQARWLVMPGSDRRREGCGRVPAPNRSADTGSPRDVRWNHDRSGPSDRTHTLGARRTDGGRSSRCGGCGTSCTWTRARRRNSTCRLARWRCWAPSSRSR